MSTENKKSEFDADKFLRSFEEDVGCKLGTIASTLQFQSEETKEKNWNTFSKGKDELTTFVEIYTIVMCIIAYTLKSKGISQKPSKNCIKSVTIKLITKLPKSNNNKPVLSKSLYMNNIHHLLNEIHDESQDINPIITQTTMDREDNLASYFQQQTNEQTDKTTNDNPWTSTASQLTPEPEPFIAAPTMDYKPVGKDLAILTTCICIKYSKDGTDYSGKTCTITSKYDEDFSGYYVKFDGDLGPETFLTLNKLSLKEANNNDTAGDYAVNVATITARTNATDAGETRKSDGFKISKYLPVLTKDNNNNDYNDNDNGRNIMDRISFGECRDCISTDCWDRIPDKFKKNCCFRMIGLIILIVISSWMIDYGKELTADGEAYAAESTEEKCSIVGWTKDECTFDCECDSYKEKYGDRVYKCEDDDCSGYEYSYIATAGEKCGNTELNLNDYDTLDTCGDEVYAVGEELDCYVLECEDKEFTFTHPDTLTMVGQTITTMGAIILVFSFICCLICAPLICSCC